MSLQVETSPRPIAGMRPAPPCPYCDPEHDPERCCCEPFTHENRCPACVVSLAALPTVCACAPPAYDTGCPVGAHALWAAQDAADARTRASRRRHR